MKKLLPYLKGYTKECILGPLFKLLEASFELAIPLVVAAIIDNGVKAQNRSYIISMCSVMVLLGAVGLVSAITAQYFAAKAAVGFAGKLRYAVMKHILGLDYTKIDTVATSTMITRMTADINQVQNGVNLTLRLLLRSPFVVFGAMIMAFTIDAQAALIFVGLIAVLCLVVFGIMLITMPMFKRVQSRLDGVTASTRENLSGVRVLRAFCKEEQEQTDFQKKTEELSSQQVTAGRISGLMNPLTFALVNLAVVLLVQHGAIKVEAGILTQGLVIALYNYMSQILIELVKMANLIITMTKAAASGSRLSEILHETSTQSDGKLEADRIRGEVSFENVSLSYAESSAPSLEHISFRAAPGDTIGIIGGTGSGKTSLVNLIARFYDATDGTIRIDGKDIKTFTKKSLRHHIGIVPQKSVLFQGSIRENLLWGREDASEEELWAALEIAQAKEIVLNKDGQLDAPVQQGGSNFSGGQKQRLTIARALVRKPAILILDDSASALDYATDAKLRMAIRNMKPAPTTFIVSQRAASVRFADLILVLEDGELAGTGTHGELLENCQVYREIFHSQFGKEGQDNG